MVDRESRRIVVGVDGSEQSKQALRWAARQAALVGTGVDAVTVWEYPFSYGWGLTADHSELAGYATETLDKALHEVLGSDPAVDVTRSVVRGDPATRVLEATEGASLLVVGNRGHGAFVGALLGSVSYRCVHRAKCPVVVVHGGD